MAKSNNTLPHYSSIKLYTKSYEKLEDIRLKLREYGVYLNKSQTLDYAIAQLSKSLQKLKKDTDVTT